MKNEERRMKNMLFSFLEAVLNLSCDDLGLRHFRFCDEEDSGLSDEEQERKGPKNRPKHTRKRIHQAKKNFLEKFKTAS